MSANPKILALQRTLNYAAGAHLVEDGLAGPATRQALYDAFANRAAPAVREDELAALAQRLDPSPAALKRIRAVAEVESGGGGFLPTGHPKILWERHYFFKRLQIKLPLISDPAPGGYTLDANHNGINDSWEKLCDAAMRAPAWAIESASWGKFQIMGAWWAKLGYDTAWTFAWSMRQGEAAHYEALVRFIERFALVAAFRSIDGNPANCTAFARGFNGKSQKGYDGRIAAAFRVQR